jgi:hypothetical protein
MSLDARVLGTGAVHAEQADRMPVSVHELVVDYVQAWIWVPATRARHDQAERQYRCHRCGG